MSSQVPVARGRHPLACWRLKFIHRLALPSIPPLPSVSSFCPPSPLHPSESSSTMSNSATDLRTIYDLVLPGSHDAGAYRIPLCNTTPAGAPRILALPPLRTFLRRTLCDFSRTQDGDLLHQMRAGSRYHDLRISAVTRSRVMISTLPPGSDDDFWLVHGAVACVPLGEALASLRTFAAEMAVARLLGNGWDDGTKAKLAARFVDALGRGNIYAGDVAGLKETPYAELPPHVVAGVPGLCGLNAVGEQFGSDIWINTVRLPLFLFLSHLHVYVNVYSYAHCFVRRESAASCPAYISDRVSHCLLLASC
jgi:hypothetical protein